MLLDFNYRLIGLKVHRLLTWKVNSKLDYRRILFINWELKQLPDGLRWANITALQILAYLITICKL